jgi:hypothetical protein
MDDDAVRLYTPGNESPCASLPLIFLQVFVFGSVGLSIFGDGIVVASICYMLYMRSSQFTPQ